MTISEHLFVPRNKSDVSVILKRIEERASEISKGCENVDCQLEIVRVLCSILGELELPRYRVINTMRGVDRLIKVVKPIHGIDQSPEALVLIVGWLEQLRGDYWQRIQDNSWLYRGRQFS